MFWMTETMLYGCCQKDAIFIETRILDTHRSAMLAFRNHQLSKWTNVKSVMSQPIFLFPSCAIEQHLKMFLANLIMSQWHRPLTSKAPYQYKSQYCSDQHLSSDQHSKEWNWNILLNLPQWSLIWSAFHSDILKCFCLEWEDLNSGRK